GSHSWRKVVIGEDVDDRMVLGGCEIGIRPPVRIVTRRVGPKLTWACHRILWHSGETVCHDTAARVRAPGGEDRITRSVVGCARDTGKRVAAIVSGLGRPARQIVEVEEHGVTFPGEARRDADVLRLPI